MDFGQRSAPGRQYNSSTRRQSGGVGGHQQESGEMMPTGGGNGHVPIQIMHGRNRSVSGLGAGLAAARSPPKTKSTSHVPCKFYPTGQCQAGSACQFSHDLDPTTQNAPCKYFARGSCKFGQSCALMHILPDGRVTNRIPRGGGGGGPGGGGMPPYGRRSTNGNAGMHAMSSTPLAISTQDVAAQSSDYSPYQTQEPTSAYTQQPSSPVFRAEVYSSDYSSPYGSPHGEYLQSRSPPRQGLTARDAPMPASWDSQGVSQAARHGPFAASVPGRFGLDSPQFSYPIQTQLGNTALRDRDAAFGDTANLDGVLHGLGSSPRDSEPLTFAKRPLHSERFARPRPLLSASLDVRSTQYMPEPAQEEPDMDSDDDGVGEDLLPSSLHDLLPIDKPRRASRNGISEEDSSSPWSAPRRISGNGTTFTSQPGSLSPHSSSPSRYSAMWAARSAANTSKPTDNEPSAFGHVGSPLRPSNLRTSSTTASPPSSNTPSGLSMLTSQLRGAKLSDSASISSPPIATPEHHTRTTSNTLSTRPSLNERPQSSGFSSTNNTATIGTLGMRDKIDEETMFSMEDEVDTAASNNGHVERSEAEPKKESAAPLVGNGPGRRTWAAMAAGNGSGVGVIGGGRGK